MKTLNKPANKLNVKILTLCAILGGALQGYSQPTMVAPTPTPPQGNVISLWNSSGTYTNITGVNFYEWWWGGQMTSGETYTVTPLTNVVQFYQTLLFDGVGFEGNVQDVSGCTNLHVDVFTPNGDSFAVRIVDNSGHSADITYTAASGVITNNGWISLDLPLSQFVAATPLLNLHYIQQLGWIINNPGEDSPADYYIDNIYFNAGTNLVYTPPPAIPAPTNNAPLPTRPSGSVLAMFDSSGTYSLWSGAGGINWHAGWSGSGESSYTITNTGNTIMYLTSLSYVGVEFYDPDQVNASPYTTFHFDLWTANGNQIGVQLVSLNPTTGPQVDLSNLPTNQWVGIDIPLSWFAATNSQIVWSDIQQLLWVDNFAPGIQGADFYIDNVYFYSNSVASPQSITATLNGSVYHLSFHTENNFNYTVQYKINLTDAVWQTLTTVPGNGAVQEVTDPVIASQRFYRLSVQ